LLALVGVTELSGTGTATASPIPGLTRGSS
jgi:hypothetical protein